MITWILESIHTEGSPIWLSREIFQNLAAALIGAFSSVILVAPLTARWIEWRARQKWKPARTYALREMAREFYTFSVALHSLNPNGEYELPERVSKDEDYIVNICNEYCSNVILSGEKIDDLYLRWADVWTPQMHSAFADLLFEVSDIRSDCSRILRISADICRIRDGETPLFSDEIPNDPSHVFTSNLVHLKDKLQHLCSLLPDKQQRSFFRTPVVFLNNTNTEIIDDVFSMLRSRWSDILYRNNTEYNLYPGSTARSFRNYVIRSIDIPFSLTSSS